MWKTYFRWHLLSEFAPYLEQAVRRRALLRSTAPSLRGIPQNRPRWKRGIELVEEAIGEALGKLYVAQYFPPEYKARMDQLVQNLLAAYRADIDTLDWMTAETTAEGAGEAREVHAQDRLSGQVARLQRAARSARAIWSAT